MLVVSFVTQKGGTGKSTLASSLAVAAHEAGDCVSILDLDPQQSLVKWSMNRQKGDIAVETVALGMLDPKLELLAESGVTLCILDTWGIESATTAAAINASDLCIIPVRPNVFDLWVGEMTRKVIRGLGKNCVFLLNQCPPAQQSVRVQAGVRALEAMGGLISPAIPMRVDFQDAARSGLGVTEVNRFGQAAEDMRNLWRSIVRVMNENSVAVTDVDSLDDHDHVTVEDYDHAIVEQEGRLDNLHLIAPSSPALTFGTQA
jgi:chromosome partitioning protein